MKEIWKDKKDYEGHYQVSNFGRVKSIKFGKERILKQYYDSNGYKIICLCKNNIKTTYLVHRLVVEAFIPNPNNLPQINHKDEDKTNNHVNNLEWCDAKYNHNYGTINERISKSQINGKRSKIVIQYNLDGTFVREWPSTMECGRNGYEQSSVADCCRGKLKTYKGFLWEYK